MDEFLMMGQRLAVKRQGCGTMLRVIPYDSRAGRLSLIQSGYWIRCRSTCISQSLAAPSVDSLVELRHLTFGCSEERVILDDVSLSIPRGKVTALMGASGGNKTTILRLIGGQNRAGQLLFDGQDVTPP
jgi:ABC-type bacteriocin/lantibiotic exporter with double-glycine peptidase domain